MDFAQDLLTQLISGFELGFAFYVVGSFISFSMRRASSESLTHDIDLPSLPELFEMAESLTVEAASEPKKPEPMQVTTLTSEPALQPLEPASEDAIAPFATLTIRQLKERAKTAKIPRYGRMTKPQLLEALQLA